MKLSILQKLLFVLIGFGLLFVHTTAAFVYLVVFFSIIAVSEYRLKVQKTNK